MGSYNLELRLPHDKVLASIRTSFNSMRATTIKLETGSKYDFIRLFALPLDWQHQVCPDYEIPSEEDTKGNLLQI